MLPDEVMYQQHADHKHQREHNVVRIKPEGGIDIGRVHHLGEELKLLEVDLQEFRLVHLDLLMAPHAKGCARRCKGKRGNCVARIIPAALVRAGDKQQAGKQQHANGVLKQLTVEGLHVIIDLRARHPGIVRVAGVHHRIIQAVVQIGHQPQGIQKHDRADSDRSKAENLLPGQLSVVHHNLL